MMHTLKDVLAVETPPSTDSYCAVPYGRLIESVREHVEKIGPVTHESWELAREGKQLFGTMRVDSGHKDHGLAIGIRSSHDKSLSVGIATGASVFVCSNLCFSGDAVTLMRAHRSQFWDSWEGLVVNALAQAGAKYDDMAEQFERMKLIDVDQDQGYGLIGIAAGIKTITPTQTNAALRAWRNPPQEAFEPRNAWSLYNALTEGAKKAPVGTSLDVHTGIHAFTVERLLRAA